MTKTPTDTQIRALRVIAKAGGHAEVWTDPPHMLKPETFAYAKDGPDDIVIRMPTLRALERDGYLARIEWEGRHQRSRITDAGRAEAERPQRVGAGAGEG